MQNKHLKPGQPDDYKKIYSLFDRVQQDLKNYESRKMPVSDQQSLLDQQSTSRNQLTVVESVSSVSNLLQQSQLKTQRDAEMHVLSYSTEKHKPKIKMHS